MLSVQLLYSNNNNAYVTWLINDRINFIRTNEAWCELACQGHQGNVFSREPHLLSKVIGREWKADSDGHNAGFSRPSWGGPPWSGSTPASSSVVVAALLAWWGRLLWRGKSGGWYPRNASKGEKLVAEDVRELYVYPSNVSCEDQEEGFWKVTQRRVVSSSLFSLSNWPGIWRWKPELTHTLAESAKQKVFHTWEINWEPWSETIFVEIPWSLKTWWVSNFAVSVAVVNFSRLVKWTALENLSTHKKV